MKQMFIVDGNSILNRAFYGVRPLTTQSGLQTGAVYGMMTILWRHLEGYRPDYALCCFDVKAPTFRHKYYDGYKATRKGMPQELAQQLPYAKKAVEALGFTVCEKEGYEADDLLGSFARQANEAGIQVKILTGDRDSLQLISDNTTVLLATNKETIPFDSAQFQSAYGILPTQFVDVKAIMGDSSDNIPGVKGIGEKGALSLIAQFGSLEGVYQNVDHPAIKDAMRQKLLSDKENAFLSQYLAKIDCFAPNLLPLEQLCYTGPKPELLFPLCSELEFFALRKRFEGILGTEQPQQTDTPCADAQNASDETPATHYQTISVDQACTLPYGRYALLWAQDGLWLSDGTQVFFVAGEDDLLCTLPLFCDNYSLCVMDGKPICHKLLSVGRSFSAAFDLSLAAYTLHARESGYDEDALVQTWLGTAYATAPQEQVMQFFALWDILDSQLKTESSAKLYYEVELPLCALLAKMEHIGFGVDRDGLAAFSDDLQKMLDGYTQRIYLQAGKAFNINSPKQLGEILFEQLGLPVKKKTKTGYSTGAEILESLRPYHPIISDILEYRQVAKLQGTYAQGLLKLADENGRLHTTFHQSKTLTGRLSSSEPNLQNIPIRTELGRQLRRYFVPKEGYLLVGADYSQIELRLLAHIANDRAMIDAFLQGVDIHTLTASQVFHTPQQEVTFEQRKAAKAVNFGIVYGISKFSLAEDLHISRMQAGDYIDRYFATYGGVASYMDSVVESAKQNGYVSTLWGRRRYIPELHSQKAPLRAFGERIARNSPIQGTAADLMKAAMLSVDRALQEANVDAHIILQIHDELIVEASEACAAQVASILEQQMEQIGTLCIPLLANASIGKNLLDSKS